MRKLALSAALAATAALSFGFGGSPAGALVPRDGLILIPDYCVALYGDPDPCPPPDRPDPVDPHCLRTDIAPLDCPYLP